MGGSHLANEEALDFVQDTLSIALAEGELGPSDIAAYIKDFERQKQDLDPEANLRDGRVMILHGRDTPNIPIQPAKVKEFFDRALGPGMRALKQQLDHLMRFKKSFTVIYVGGTSGMTGVQKQVIAMHQQLNARAKSQGFEIRHIFMAGCEAHMFVPCFRQRTCAY